MQAARLRIRAALETLDVVAVGNQQAGRGQTFEALADALVLGQSRNHRGDAGHVLVDAAEFSALVERLQDMMAQHVALAGILGDEGIFLARQRRDHGVDRGEQRRIDRFAGDRGGGKARVAVVELEFGCRGHQ